MEISLLEIQREIDRLDFVISKFADLPDDEFAEINSDIEQTLSLLKDLYKEKSGFVYYYDYNF